MQHDCKLFFIFGAGVHDRTYTPISRPDMSLDVDDCLGELWPSTKEHASGMSLGYAPPCVCILRIYLEIIWDPVFRMLQL